MSVFGSYKSDHMLAMHVYSMYTRLSNQIIVHLRSYYFNYLTKAMSLEDPRIRMRQLQQPQDPSITNMAEHIPLQVSGGNCYVQMSSVL